MTEPLDQSDSGTEVDEPNRINVQPKFQYKLPPKLGYARRLTSKYINGKLTQIEQYVANKGNSVTTYESYYNMICDMLSNTSECEKKHIIRHIKHKSLVDTNDLKVLIESMPYRTCQRIVYYITRRQRRYLPPTSPPALSLTPPPALSPPPPPVSLPPVSPPAQFQIVPPPIIQAPIQSIPIQPLIPLNIQGVVLPLVTVRPVMQAIAPVFRPKNISVIYDNDLILKKNAKE